MPPSWGFALSQSDKQGFDLARPVQFDIADPRDIDLAEVVAMSEQNRLQAIGPQLTVDFDQLPEGWEAETFHLGTVDSGYLAPPGGPVFWHQLGITRPDGPDVVINVQGPLDWRGELIYTSAGNSDRGPVEIRGQPGIQTLGSMRWVEQGRVVLEIVRNGGTVNDFDSETGQLAGVEWRIVAPKEDAVLIVEPSFRDAGGLPYTEPASYEDVNISIDTFEGGELVWGNTPPEVMRVRLLTQDSVVVLPTASLGLDRRLFAVPIDDRLDPIKLEFLDGVGLQIAQFDLSDLVPYSLGGGQTTTSVDLPISSEGD